MTKSLKRHTMQELRDRLAKLEENRHWTRNEDEFEFLNMEIEDVLQEISDREDQVEWETRMGMRDDTPCLENPMDWER